MSDRSWGRLRAAILHHHSTREAPPICKPASSFLPFCKSVTTRRVAGLHPPQSVIGAANHALHTVPQPRQCLEFNPSVWSATTHLGELWFVPLQPVFFASCQLATNAYDLSVNTCRLMAVAYCVACRFSSKTDRHRRRSGGHQRIVGDDLVGDEKIEDGLAGDVS